MKFAWTSLLVVFAALGAMADGAAWEFSRQTVIQRWPWNRKVDVMFRARVVDGAGTRCRAAHVALKVKGVAVPESELDTAWILGEGYQTIVWNPAETGYPSELTSADLAVEVLEDVKDVGYLMIDLATGARAYKPLSFSNEVNTATYKTTHMAFRYIPSTISGEWRGLMHKATFKMGSDGTRTDIGIIQSDKDREGRADITLTKGYFFGVFPVTGKQYKLLGGTTTYGDDQAVQRLNYDTIRGPDGTNNVDGVDGRYCFPKSTEVKAESPIGVLRKRTGLMFDLPTEAQWEYAARAGSEGEYFFPDTITGQQNVLNELNKYGAKIDSTAVSVGTKRPNAWGIYDLIGCCHQWTTTCGKYKSSDAYTKNKDATDPIGLTPNAGSGVMRFLRGSHNGTNGGSVQCRVQRLAYRMVQASNVVTDSGEGRYAGFRLALTLDCD